MAVTEAFVQRRCRRENAQPAGALAAIARIVAPMATHKRKPEHVAGRDDDDPEQQQPSWCHQRNCATRIEQQRTRHQASAIGIREARRDRPRVIAGEVAHQPCTRDRGGDGHSGWCRLVRAGRPACRRLMRSRLAGSGDLRRAIRGRGSPRPWSCGASLSLRLHGLPQSGETRPRSGKWTRSSSACRKRSAIRVNGSWPISIPRSDRAHVANLLVELQVHGLRPVIHEIMRRFSRRSTVDLPATCKETGRSGQHSPTARLEGGLPLTDEPQ